MSMWPSDTSVWPRFLGSAMNHLAVMNFRQAAWCCLWFFWCVV